MPSAAATVDLPTPPFPVTTSSGLVRSSRISREGPYWRPERTGRAQDRSPTVDGALTMSVSPSFPQGAPSLAEVLITRTFAKPTNPFVDGEFLQALEHADDGESKTAVAPPKPGRHALGASGRHGWRGCDALAGRARRRVDVRV